MSSDTSRSSTISSDLFQLALSVRKNSYSPYSQYAVAAAVFMDDGRSYAGVNVENASYGATICAERSAILTAISNGAQSLKEIVVITKNPNPGPPCGNCLQVMSEFADPDTLIHLANPEGIQITKTFKEFLPLPFSRQKVEA